MQVIEQDATLTGRLPKRLFGQRGVITVLFWIVLAAPTAIARRRFPELQPRRSPRALIEI